MGARFTPLGELDLMARILKWEGSRIFAGDRPVAADGASVLDDDGPGKMQIQVRPRR